MRNRFTIDTDIVFDVEPDQDIASTQEPDSQLLQQDKDPEQQLQQPELAGDTDRWVEEQFDLEIYEDQEEVKETDILSDEDDEFSQSARALSTKANLEASIMALSLESEETESLKSPMASGTPDDVRLSDSEKQSVVIDDNVEDQKQMEDDEIWVKRQQSRSSPDCGT